MLDAADITEIRVKLVGDRDGKLLAFVSLTIKDAFVVRDIRVVKVHRSGSTHLHVAMPSRLVTDHCESEWCHFKNGRLSRFCGGCGARLNPHRTEQSDGLWPKIYTDVACPISTDCRKLVEDLVVKAYYKELDYARYAEVADSWGREVDS